MFAVDEVRGLLVQLSSPLFALAPSSTLALTLQPRAVSWSLFPGLPRRTEHKTILVSGLDSVEQFRAFNAAWTLQRVSCCREKGGGGGGGGGVHANPVEPG